MSEPTTIRLGEARDRLAEQCDEVEALAEEADDTASAESVQWSLNELNQQGAAVADLLAEHGADATVTVHGLTAGEFGRVEDRVQAMRDQRDGQASLPGYHRVVYAAAGLDAAPFFDPDDVANPPWEQRSARERLDAKVAAVADLPPALAKWLYARVDEATTPDTGNWRSSAGSPPADDSD